MIDNINISDEDVAKILALQENHFSDLKSTDISPAKLTRTISSFSNADGGELFIGVEDDPRRWRGFKDVESANSHVQTFEEFFPLGDGYIFSFLSNNNQPGIVLKIEIQKSRSVKQASDGKVYLRRGAQNLPVIGDEANYRLKINKGIASFETETINIEKDVIENSHKIIEFMLEVVPTSEPEPWLVKQRLIINGHPTVAGVLLFAEEPQAILPKHCGIKLYQYATKDEEGNREELVSDPLTIEGCLYDIIKVAVEETKALIEATRIMTPEGLKAASYPHEALHEIVTNAVIHRDYSITDDIHIRVFDNRVEIQSPGTLPAHITTENILDERFARNGVIVRLINKFPNPPNKDVGEGLNTAFKSMRDMRLRDPIIEQKGGNVLVTLKHESLGTPQELIMKFLENHEIITNREAREICNVGSENAMKHILKRMVDARMIDVVTGKTVFQTSYKKA